MDDIDHCIVNGLTELFWGLNKDNSKKSIAKIKSLLPKIEVGNKITFWNGKRNYLQKRIKPVTPAAKSVTKNEYITYYFKNPPRHMGVSFAEFEIEAKVKNADLLKPSKRAQKNPRKEELRRLTRTTRFWPVDSRRVASLRKKLDINHLNDTEKTIWIHHWIRSNITGYEGPSKRLGVEETIIHGKGNCWECSDLFVTLCRKYSIPARQLAGWLYEKGGVNSGHAWAEVFLEDHGWMPVDAVARSLQIPNYYIPYFATDDGKLPVVYLSRPKTFVE